MTNRTEVAENQEKTNSPQEISGVAGARRMTSERSTSKRKFLKLALLAGGAATLALAWSRGVNASSLDRSSTSLVSSKANGKQSTWESTGSTSSHQTTINSSPLSRRRSRTLQCRRRSTRSTKSQKHWLRRSTSVASTREGSPEKAEDTEAIEKKPRLSRGASRRRGRSSQ